MWVLQGLRGWNSWEVPATGVRSWKKPMHSWCQQLEGVRSSESAAGRHLGHTVPCVSCGAAGGLPWLVQVPETRNKPFATGPLCPWCQAAGASEDPSSRWSTDRSRVPAGQQPQGPLPAQLPLTWCVWVWAGWQAGGLRTMQRVHASAGGENECGDWVRQVGEFMCVC